ELDHRAEEIMQREAPAARAQMVVDRLAALADAELRAAVPHRVLGEHRDLAADDGVDLGLRPAAVVVGVFLVGAARVECLQGADRLDVLDASQPLLQRAGHGRFPRYASASRLWWRVGLRPAGIS